ncbi:MAG: insulinase family protein [Myxococcales bacterium]|nr:insulinase family protein [Myxococcales bacterium]MCB9519859.1 insulinase family protein [Myxococcales bacterium]MCB9532303.1 insulinase family protein [Myxococcales bacterium]
MRALAKCAALLAAALTGHAAHAAAPQIAIDVTTVQLDNGLRVVLAPSSAAPTIGVAVYYDVGSRNEVQGRSGFAHLFEHMMFQGSENLGKGEHFRQISRNGGRMNGTTSEDRTNYFESLPADQLELALWLESDRMRSLAITQENFENQREVVKEERRLRVDNVAYVPAQLEFNELAYSDFPYSHSVIGSMADLDAATLADVQAFFDTYYAPNNAVLGISGDFDPDQALLLVEAYFGDIPAGPAPPAVVIDEPVQRERRERTVDDPFASQPALQIGWQCPAADHADAPALALLGNLLAAGESSRLYDRLVRRDAIALNVTAGADGRRGPDIFSIWATANGAEPAALRDAILDEIAALRDAPPSAAELEAAKQQYYQQLVGWVETNLGRALTTTRDMLYFGSPTYSLDELAAIDAVTPDDVLRVANAYLDPAVFTAVYVVPKPEEEPTEAQ